MSFDAHFKAVDTVLITLNEAGVYLNLSNRCFITDSVKCLGHIKNRGALTINEARVESLYQLQLPQNVSKL